MQETSEVILTAMRKSNSKRPHLCYVTAWCHRVRKRVETHFSIITRHFSRNIHAVTARGFELKVFLTVLVISMLS